jgi:CHAD domain-containing protein
MPAADLPVLASGGDPRIGDLALGLIQQQVRRLGQLHHAVLADDDPEALHKLRISLRRLRSGLEVFAPALLLPEGVHASRLARVARRTGLTRDLDVFREWLEDPWWPQLPEGEQVALAKAMARLKRDRRQAFEGMVEALNGGRYLKLLALLNQWQASPNYSLLGQQRLKPWLSDWVCHLGQGLFLHNGWFVADPAAEDLHELRKRIKGLRYNLEPFIPFLPTKILDWIEELKQAQTVLGELHDLTVLEASLLSQPLRRKASPLPTLQGAISQRQQQHWQQWQAQAGRLSSDANRQDLHRLILAPADNQGALLGQG